MPATNRECCGILDTDTCFEYSYSKQGDKYWKFSDKRMATGYPKDITVGFAGIPNDVDAAFVWSGNGKTYFFKGQFETMPAHPLTRFPATY